MPLIASFGLGPFGTGSGSGTLLQGVDVALNLDQLDVDLTQEQTLDAELITDVDHQDVAVTIDFSIDDETQVDVQE